MADMMAIVSKAIFEKDAPKAKPGDVLPMKFYRSANKQLERLSEGGRLFLVTVRPPNEALWLVAVLESPEFDGDKWAAPPNRYPVTDLSASLDKLKFESGKGIAAKKGALGMSLQTPRVLIASDIAQLLGAAGEAPVRLRPQKGRPVNLTRHEADSPLPCLCVDCLGKAPESLEIGGALYFRAATELFERILWFWVPAELKGKLPEVTQSVQSRLRGRIAPYPPPADKSKKKPRPKRPIGDDGDDDDDDE